jgi:hypothetical protein
MKFYLLLKAPSNQIYHKEQEKKVTRGIQNDTLFINAHICQLLDLTKKNHK